MLSDNNFWHSLGRLIGMAVRRRAVNNRLQTALYHWTRVALQHGLVSRAKYNTLRARGHRHARALRGVAAAFSKSLASCWKTNSCLIMITPNMNWPLRTLSQWVAGLPPLHLPLINGRISPLVEACCKRPKRRHAFGMQLPAVADEFKVFRVWRRVARPEISAT